MMKQEFFGPIVIVVIATTILTPILLKLAYSSSAGVREKPEQSAVVDRYEDAQAFDLASQALLEDHERLMNSGKRDKS